MSAFAVTVRQVVCCAVAGLAVIGVISCSTAANIGGANVACAGQCAPPYELQVDFHPGTAVSTAQQILSSCAAHNPVVIRIGKLEAQAGGWKRAMIYTHVFGRTARTAGLLKCLRSSGVALAAWPD